MTHVNGAKQRRGFTLVEVLATLVLIGVVLPVAMNGVALALSAASNARHTTEAAQLAQNKLNELVLTGDWSLSGTSGDFAPDWPAYRWTVESGTTNSNDYGLTEVRVWVFWTDRGRERALSVATLVPDTSTLEVTQ